MKMHKVNNNVVYKKEVDNIADVYIFNGDQGDEIKKLYKECEFKYRPIEEYIFNTFTWYKIYPTINSEKLIFNIVALTPQDIYYYQKELTKTNILIQNKDKFINETKEKFDEYYQCYEKNNDLESFIDYLEGYYDDILYLNSDSNSNLEKNKNDFKILFETPEHMIYTYEYYTSFELQNIVVIVYEKEPESTGYNYSDWLEMNKIESIINKIENSSLFPISNRFLNIIRDYIYNNYDKLTDKSYDLHFYEFEQYSPENPNEFEKDFLSYFEWDTILGNYIHDKKNNKINFDMDKPLLVFANRTESDRNGNTYIHEYKCKILLYLP